ncbi:AAA family ATPase [Streptomyces sp. UNOB3_S3]|uniref:AAA family ATPase n=1 Tax=Streptomyces sp. UNOB3_S3 TaxID=2871682 RepID=UPI001E32EEB4|nr:AAA family ATPase [Streptomyces sp. UNOB3_S3]MCC3777768.1 AAA family ATPase [Streptomyces sp. UNOB3_S3]
MLVNRAYVPPELVGDDEADAWPWSVPCVKELLADGIVFDAPVTFLVGENGSGKSTVVEAIAEGFGLDARGGRAGRKYGNDRPKTVLGERVRLDLTSRGARMMSGPRTRKKGFFLRSETAFGLMETVWGLPGYWEENTSEMSHGEGFLAVFEAMFRQPGLYVMDEPEAALSFASCLRLVALMHRLGRSGAQVVCATHSPVLAATPGARILEVGEHGIQPVEWRDLLLVDHWRRYLSDPEAYLRHLIPAGERG